MGIYKRNPLGGSSGLGKRPTVGRPLRPTPPPIRKNNDHVALDNLFKKLDDKFNLMLDEDNMIDRVNSKMKEIDDMEIDGYKKVVNKIESSLTRPTSIRSLHHFKVVVGLILVAIITSILIMFIATYVRELYNPTPPIIQEQNINETTTDNETLKQL